MKSMACCPEAAFRRAAGVAGRRDRRRQQLCPYLGLRGCGRPQPQARGDVRRSGMAGVYRKECRSRLPAQAGIQADVAGAVRADPALNDLISRASPARPRTLGHEKQWERRRNNLAHSSHHGAWLLPGRYRPLGDGERPGFSGAADQNRHRLRSWRPRRHHRARRRAEDVGFARQAGRDREHAGRRRNGRCAVGRAGGAGRPYDALGQRPERRSSPSLFKSMPYEWSRDFTPVSTDRAVRFRHRGRQGQPAQDRQRSHRGRQEQSGELQHRHDQRRQRAEPVRSPVCLDGRSAGDHCAVPHHRGDGHGACCPTRSRSASRRCRA